MDASNPTHRNAPAGARRLRAVSADMPVELTVVLRPSRPLDLKARARLPLLPAHYQATYGTSVNTLAAVLRYAAAFGLKASADGHPHHVRITGRMGDALRAFPAEDIGVWQKDDRQFVARTGRLFLPRHLYADIVAVLGFDRRPVARPYARAAQARATAAWKPADLAEHYGFPVGLTGAGQTIGIIELGGGYDPAQIASYFAASKVARTGGLVAVPVGAASNAPDGDPGGPDGEVQLDIEVAGSVAPAADLAVYFGGADTAGFLGVIAAAVNDATHKPSVISISWGSPESGYAIQDLNAFDQTFAQAAMLGITVCVASGDAGSSDGEQGLHVDFPASSPHVLACGGTRLPRTGAEVAWGGRGDGASGGGYSRHFARPSWQAGNARPTRGVPDVAADADPATGYVISVDGERQVIGGTSAAAPLWAGLIALGNQSAGRRAGLVNPALYADPVVCNDITSGTNGAYKAAVGWDPVTGLGSPKGEAVVAALSPSRAAKP
ncbi:MAG TPA: S53 family peptidase [Acidisphaera sp.]|nr:S53 family peptidase [Acidisphaera sp.]